MAKMESSWKKELRMGLGAALGIHSKETGPGPTAVRN